MRCSSLLLSIAVVLFGNCVSQVAMAAGITGPKKSALEKLESGPAVRERMQLRGGRFTAAPAFGMTMNDPFRRNALVGAQLTYHFSDSMGLAATGLYGIAFDTGLTEQIGEKRKSKSSGGFSDVQALVDVAFEYVPVTGKLAIVGREVLSYDFHVVGGVGGAKVVGSVDADSFAIAPVLGIGLRVFPLTSVSVNIEVRDYIYSAATHAVEDTLDGKTETRADASWSNHFATTIGVGFAFPQDPEVRH